MIFAPLLASKQIGLIHEIGICVFVAVVVGGLLLLSCFCFLCFFRASF